MQAEESVVPQENSKNLEPQEVAQAMQNMTTPVAANAANPFHSNLDISAEAGKKFKKN